MAATTSDNASNDTQETTTSSNRPNLQKGRPRYFPLSYKDAFSQWWAGLTPAQTEHRVLSYIPHLQKPQLEVTTQTLYRYFAGASGVKPVESSTSTTSVSTIPSVTSYPEDPYGIRKWYTSLVKLSGKDRALNEFCVERVGEKVDNDLVILHGYGAGLGFFYKNFEALSRLPGWRLFALDMLGMGRSSRPAFRIHAKDHKGKIQEAENWFIDALEEWRIKKNINKFTLVGHSMGGYMAVAYALKYPGNLKKLVLVSPVGIPEDPYAVNADLPEPEDTAMLNEFTQDQDAIVDPKKSSDKQPPRRPYPKWLTYLWDANISPFSLVRLSGPFGPSLVSGWTSRRFSHLPTEEAQALHDYSYSLFTQRGSGEYALAYILAPGAFARSPLIRRIHGVGRQILAPHDAPTVDGDVTKNTKKRENGIPVVLMYGDHDWMDVAGGFAAERKILDEKEKALQGKSAKERKQDEGDAKVVIVKNAGHHLYLDGYDEFNEVMVAEMKDVEKRERAKQSKV